MMDSKDASGKPLFKVLKVGMACDACQAAGIASECTHSESRLQIYPLYHVAHVLSFSLNFFYPLGTTVESFRPPWKSASKVSCVLLYVARAFSRTHCTHSFDLFISFAVRHGQADLLYAEGHV